MTEEKPKEKANTRVGVDRRSALMGLGMLGLPFSTAAMAADQGSDSAGQGGAMKIGVHRLEMSAPNDISKLRGLIESGQLNPAHLTAVIGKTEGNGAANDFTRGYALVTHENYLVPLLNVSLKQLHERICFVWSGGTEGVISPHATYFTRERGGVPAGNDKRLAIGVSRTRDLLPEEIGTMAQVKLVADAVQIALKDAGIEDPADVHWVQIKGPMLTSASIQDADRRGKKLVTRDPNESKAYGTGAPALGIALALGEVNPSDLSDGVIAKRFDLFSRVASVSTGSEMTACDIVLFGNSQRAASNFRIGHSSLKDLIDAEGVMRALSSAGLKDERINDAVRSRIAAIFVKTAPSPNGRIRGRRTTMLSDADIKIDRTIRSVAGGVIASVTGDSAIFVSGAGEHNGAPGESPIAAIISV